ncbi:hypothetical protein [Thalassomonas sp. RHCl1]|uniref:hypothetical protein n=1 Tax=Thalassomonas sp. RHCl1 TaxID=2995320 RepID=UPI00248C6246|nr:hypothetical protein [Thalassomonas sp. RHCl1]
MKPAKLAIWLLGYALAAPGQPWAQEVRALSESNIQAVNVTPDGTSFVILHPGDHNGDGSVRLCLTPGRSDCDYISDELTPQQTLAVKLPFKGQIIMPHEITYIYPSDLDPANIPGSMDEATNIYLKNDTSNPDAPRYRGLNNGQKHFSDYLEFEVDHVNKRTIIYWDITQDEGLLGDAINIDFQSASDWHISFAMSGFPYFDHRRRTEPSNFTFSISSEQAAGLPHYYTPTLEQIEIVY